MHAKLSLAVLSLLRVNHLDTTPCKSTASTDSNSPISAVARENILYFSSDRILSTTVFVSHAIEGTLHRSSAQTPRISQVKHLRHDVITSITDDSTRHRKARIIVGWESRDDLNAARFTFYTQEMNRNLHLPSLRALLFAHFREAVPLACAALLPCFREAVPLARALFIADSLAAAAFCRFAAFFLGCLRAFAVCFAASAAAAARTDPLPLACAQTLQGAHAASACCGVPCCAPSPAGPVPQRCKSSGSQHRRCFLARAASAERDRERDPIGAASGAVCWQERDPERPARATIASKSHQQASKPARISSHADEQPRG